MAAEKYPSKPVRIVVGFAPAGPVDNLSRIIARRLSVRLEQQFVVDNRPGASSMIGAQMVASSEPDGYTLLMERRGIKSSLPVFDYFDLW